jgi:hypothetical protein
MADTLGIEPKSSDRQSEIMPLYHVSIEVGSWLDANPMSPPFGERNVALPRNFQPSNDRIIIIRILKAFGESKQRGDNHPSTLYGCHPALSWFAGNRYGKRGLLSFLFQRIHLSIPFGKPLLSHVGGKYALVNINGLLLNRLFNRST